MHWKTSQDRVHGLHCPSRGLQGTRSLRIFSIGTMSHHKNVDFHADLKKGVIGEVSRGVIWVNMCLLIGSEWLLSWSIFSAKAENWLVSYCNNPSKKGWWLRLQWLFLFFQIKQCLLSEKPARPRGRSHWGIKANRHNWEVTQMQPGRRQQLQQVAGY